MNFSDEVQLRLLGELVYGDMLSVVELPQFLRGVLPESSDEHDAAIGDAMRALSDEGLVAVFEVHDGDPDESFEHLEWRVAGSALSQLLSWGRWPTSREELSADVWIAATKEGRALLDSAPTEIKRKLGTLPPEEG